MRLTLILIAMSSPAFADRLNGLYVWDTAPEGGQCTMVGYDNADLEIFDNTIAFIETQCVLTEPTAIRDMSEGILYDAKCTGEGETWTERMMMYEIFDGVAIISRGAVRTFRHCQ
ncbi:hypothetical protein N9741_02600 [Octadecabacter sp.]|nr:hypothetical protein [Octadecabacter sp.]